MKKLLFFIIAIICICFFVFYKQDHFEDKGVWVKLSEDIPEGGYLLHNNNVYGCYLDTLSDIDKIPPLKGVDVSTFEVCKGTEYARTRIAFIILFEPFLLTVKISVTHILKSIS